jgi:hypothetical protein
VSSNKKLVSTTRYNNLSGKWSREENLCVVRRDRLFRQRPRSLTHSLYTNDVIIMGQLDVVLTGTSHSEKADRTLCARDKYLNMSVTQIMNARAGRDNGIAAEGSEIDHLLSVTACSGAK